MNSNGPSALSIAGLSASTSRRAPGTPSVPTYTPCCSGPAVTKNRNRRPSGRKCGHEWLRSPARSSVSGTGSPPSSEKRRRGPLGLAPNRMVPSALHAPPVAVGTGAVSVRGDPPSRSTRFSAPSTKNAIDRLSGDQNGADPRSVPGIGAAVTDARGRSHNCDVPFRWPE